MEFMSKTYTKVKSGNFINGKMHNIEDLCCQMEEICRFCLPPEKERIIYTTEHFYVMVSLGPIVEGYLLIISKEHIGACLHLPVEYMEEFCALKEKIYNILTEVYGACIFYEHGKISSCVSEGQDHIHCFHAHLHCIPANVKLNRIIGEEIEGQKYRSLLHCYEAMKDIDKYLYVEDRYIMAYLPQKKLQRQYLRYKLAEALGLANRWDWVNNQNWPLIEQTITKLKPYFI
jgi:diadenosine tetraphosphate (Ap4A) HIT family hydrolase